MLFPGELLDQVYNLGVGQVNTGMQSGTRRLYQLHERVRLSDCATAGLCQNLFGSGDDLRHDEEASQLRMSEDGRPRCKFEILVFQLYMQWQE